MPSCCCFRASRDETVVKTIVVIAKTKIKRAERAKKNDRARIGDLPQQTKQTVKKSKKSKKKKTHKRRTDKKKKKK